MTATRGSYIDENRELAFKTWRQCGQNVERTIRALKKDHGLPVTKPTLYDWMEKFNWKERAARAEAEEQKTGDLQMSFEEKMLADLIKQKEKYERYFETLKEGTVDNQAAYAYASLVRLIADIKKKTPDPSTKTKKSSADEARGAKAVGLTKEKAKEIKDKILGIQ